MSKAGSKHFPYHPGLEVTIKAHVPPQPGHNEELKSYAGIQAVPSLFPNSSINGSLRPSSKEMTSFGQHSVHTLHVVNQIACGETRNSQVVRCYLDNATDQLYVAKIFDSLYFEPSSEYPTVYANESYAQEAASYEEIKAAGMDGRYTPKYYGSWTFSLSASDSHTSRSVRMVLIEEIAGHSIYQILRKGLVSRVPPADRLTIVAEVYRIYSELEFIGVRCQDLAPRNVLLSGLSLDQSAEYTLPRVVLIDFEAAVITSRPSSHFVGDPKPPKPIDPRFYLGDYCHREWEEWVPDPHWWDKIAWSGWVRSLWPDGPEYGKHRLQKYYDKKWAQEEIVIVPPEPDKPVLNEGELSD